MKFKQFNKAILLAITISLLASCSLIKDLKYEVNPSPVEMHGDEITININGEFVEKGLNSKVLVELTPVLVNKKGEEMEFNMTAYKGEKAPGNATKVPKTGLKFKYTSSRKYDPAFDNAVLKVKYKVFKGSKMKKEGVTDSIAGATITTPLWLQNDDKVVLGKDNLIRSVNKTTKTVINYEKAKSFVSEDEVLDEDMIKFEVFLSSIKHNPKVVLKKMKISSYASPEGSVEKNTTLAIERGESANKYLGHVNTKLNSKITQEMIEKAPKGEDWEGLKELIGKSNHEDKNIILRVAEMNSDPQQREDEIRALASTYKFIDEDIFPKLRRSQLILSYVVNGLTDDELKQQSLNPRKLNVEELLFTGNNLTQNMEAREKLYKEAIKKADDDWRGYNNAGAALYAQGKISEAKTMFEKAYQLEANPVTSNNWGAMLRQDGKISEAEEMFAAAEGEDADYNMALVNIRKGNYSNAISNMKGNTYNKALAQVLNKDFANGLTTLKNSEDNETARGNYLKAIIAQRTGDDKTTIIELKAAIYKDAKLKAKAMQDREFIKLFNNPDFIGM